MTTETQEKFKEIFEQYLKEVDRFNNKDFLISGRRARALLMNMKSLIHKIRKELSVRRKDLLFKKKSKSMYDQAQ